VLVSRTALTASWEPDTMDRLHRALTTGTQPALLARHDSSDTRVFVVTLHGAIDFVEESVLASVLRAFDDGRLPNARVDLRQVTFIDSTGLAFLVHLRRMATKRGGEVTLVGASGICLEAIEIVRFDTIFTMVP